MSVIAKRIGLFFTIYMLAFLVFSIGSHAQTSPTQQPGYGTAAPNARPLPTNPVVNRPAAAAQQPNAGAPQAPGATTNGTAGSAPAQPPGKNLIVTVQPQPKGYKKVFALISTTMGDIKILLYHAQVPHTVENFVALVEGQKEFTDIKTKELVKRPFYDGLTFHRVRKNFVIQTGDPAGDGTGSPGFTIKDEFHPDLKHRKAGMVSMANNGADTGNTQFFITLSEQKDFDKRYPVFGEVVEGMDVVNKIGNVKTNRITEKPVTPIIINKITIIRE